MIKLILKIYIFETSRLGVSKNYINEVSIIIIGLFQFFINSEINMIGMQVRDSKFSGFYKQSKKIVSILIRFILHGQSNTN